MASLPSHASSQRRFPELSAESPSQNHSQSQSPSDHFDLNRPQTTLEPSASEVELQQDNIAPEPAEELYRCWICQQDSSEDAPGALWRRPCPCSLTAHDECLLEWITAEEAPRPGDLATTRRIVCPQCHAEIQIERPRDYLVLAVDSVRQVSRALILPAALSSLVACFYSGFLIYGINTLGLIMGREEAYRIMALPGTRDLRALHLMPQENNSRTLQRASQFLRRLSMSVDPFFPSMDWMPHWKLFVGLPLIAPSLVLSRTRLAEPYLTLVPLTVRQAINLWIQPANSWVVRPLPSFRLSQSSAMATITCNRICSSPRAPCLVQ
jgi:hypothetical protein